MPWEEFTDEHAGSRITARELQEYEETTLAEYPEDGGEAVVPPNALERLPQIRSQVYAQFRGAIRSNPRSIYMGPTGTLPDFCIGHAAVIARFALIGMPLVPEGANDTRLTEYKTANDFLKSLKDYPAAMFDEDDQSSAASYALYGGMPLLDF